MPRVHQRVAAKDYPNFGIEKGQKHYHWVLKTGPRSSREFRQINAPKRSQLTTSDFLGQAYDIQDERLITDNISSADDLNSIADDVEALGQEQQEKFDNMPEGLQQGPTGEMLEERVQQCESWAESIRSAASDLEQALDELQTEEEKHNELVAAWETFNSDESGDAEEPEEEEPDDRDFEAERTQAIDDALDAIDCEI